MSLEFYQKNKVQVKFNDEIFIERLDHAIKKKTFQDPKFGEFFSTEKVSGDMFNLI